MNQKKYIPSRILILLDDFTSILIARRSPRSVTHPSANFFKSTTILASALPLALALVSLPDPAQRSANYLKWSFL